ncbi:hypothetical protein LZ32DRAFT_385581 [Colletotrichum eremochloae]|nr:hypothetical protein LZ32DRAFT_385581 [Colletotrichum eremochloae]
MPSEFRLLLDIGRCFGLCDPTGAPPWPSTSDRGPQLLRVINGCMGRRNMTGTRCLHCAVSGSHVSLSALLLVSPILSSLYQSSFFSSPSFLLPSISLQYSSSQSRPALLLLCEHGMSPATSGPAG